MSTGSANEPATARQPTEGRHTAYAAKPVGKLTVSHVPLGAIDLSVFTNRRHLGSALTHFTGHWSLC